jgi:hypothetical protein
VTALNHHVAVGVVAGKGRRLGYLGSTGLAEKASSGDHTRQRFQFQEAKPERKR